MLTSTSKLDVATASFGPSCSNAVGSSFPFWRKINFFGQLGLIWPILVSVHGSLVCRMEAKAARTLTIFYEGQVFMFEDFPADKVKVLIKLLESASSPAPPILRKAVVMGLSNLNLHKARNASLQRFLEKRKHRWLDLPTTWTCGDLDGNIYWPIKLQDQRCLQSLQEGDGRETCSHQEACGRWAHCLLAQALKTVCDTWGLRVAVWIRILYYSNVGEWFLTEPKQVWKRKKYWRIIFHNNWRLSLCRILWSKEFYY